MPYFLQQKKSFHSTFCSKQERHCVAPRMHALYPHQIHQQTAKGYTKMHTELNYMHLIKEK